MVYYVVNNNECSSTWKLTSMVKSILRYFTWQKSNSLIIFVTLFFFFFFYFLVLYSSLFKSLPKYFTIKKKNCKLSQILISNSLNLFIKIKITIVESDLILGYNLCLICSNQLHNMKSITYFGPYISAIYFNSSSWFILFLVDILIYKNKKLGDNVNIR